nr:MAG TPA: hypothetical protein [Caudoviricetes sp.]
MAFEDNLLYYSADYPRKCNMSMNHHYFSDD